MKHFESVGHGADRHGERHCAVYPNEHCPTCPWELPLGGCERMNEKGEVKDDVDL